MLGIRNVSIRVHAKLCHVTPNHAEPCQILAGGNRAEPCQILAGWRKRRKRRKWRKWRMG